MPHSSLHPLFAALALVIIFAAGCQTSNSDRAAAEFDDRLAGTDWLLVQIESDEADVASDELTRPVTLQFTAEEHEREASRRLATGEAPCNSFSAAYRIEGESEITFDDVVTTFVACGDEVMLHERLLYDALNEATTYELDGSTLQIMSETVTLTFESI